jgi:hypothetical protein
MENVFYALSLAINISEFTYAQQIWAKYDELVLSKNKCILVRFQFSMMASMKMDVVF